MDDEKRPAGEPEETIEAPPDALWEGEDWIGEIEVKVQSLRSEMADVAREADEGMIDGPLGKVLVFLKRYWAVMLIAVLPFVPKIVERWAENDPFPAVPAIITEAELQEIGDYIVRWDAASLWNMNWTLSVDRDKDGVPDGRVHAYAVAQGRETRYVTTSLELPTLWQVITGQCGLEPQGERIALQDGRLCLLITVDGPTAGDRSELRHAVEETLAAIRQAQADEAAGISIPAQEPSGLLVFIDELLDSEQGEE